MKFSIIRDKSFLRKPCDVVASIEEGEQISKTLLEVLSKQKFGIGLSANQIGIRKQVSVIKIGDDLPLVLMNPVIVSKSNDTVIYNEGCLSLPGKLVLTKRHVQVTISTLNHGNELTFGPESQPNANREYDSEDVGLLRCVCVQHEIDHLLGKLIVDDDIRFTPPKKTWVEPGRNDKVMIQKDGATQYIKYKRAIPLIENDGWTLI